MSLYNMLFGFNPACVLLMPMLGRKQAEYPRFRDCFLSDDTTRIVIEPFTEKDKLLLEVNKQICKNIRGDEK